MSKQDTQSDLPFAPTAADIEREIVSTTRGGVYNELKDAAAAARHSGDLDKAEKLEDMVDDATKIDPAMWRDLFRVTTRSKFDRYWWSSLVHENPGQFSSLRDMIIEYATVCDAANQRGENLDERLFPDPEKVMADLRRQSAELRRKHYHELGWSVPDDE